MTYRLYRVGSLSEPPERGQPIGSFPDFDSALAVRDDDVITQLAADPQRREITHLIVGPGTRGSGTQHPVITCASADDNADLVETRRWLRQIHATSSTSDSPNR
jgi:hypothetical protein